MKKKVSTNNTKYPNPLWACRNILYKSIDNFYETKVKKNPDSMSRDSIYKI
jgi:hypothetical protein